ncbi:MAG: hypothetical protein QNJ63_00525 [Calothrix sp. MO_192.B10]|nr:hypothetical protein [Calothrix sp. MO_192.B10]
MERGILWLPLLAVFIWLAWQGAKEYQKVESYRHWAEQFERAKYDILAIIGQKSDEITWGKPTEKEPVNLQTFSLLDVSKVIVLVDGKEIDIENIPAKGRAIALQFFFTQSDHSVQIPFTEIPLAAEWCKFLQGELQRLQK